jgi:hypothetical protein
LPAWKSAKACAASSSVANDGHGAPRIPPSWTR